MFKSVSKGAGGFEHRKVAGQIGPGIREGGLKRITHTSLCAQMQDALRAHVGNQACDGLMIGQIDRLEAKSRVARQLVQARLLQLGIIVWIEIVDTDDVFTGFELRSRRVKPDEARRSCNETRQTLASPTRPCLPDLVCRRSIRSSMHCNARMDNNDASRIVLPQAPVAQQSPSHMELLEIPSVVEGGEG